RPGRRGGQGGGGRGTAGHGRRHEDREPQGGRTGRGRARRGGGEEAAGRLSRRPTDLRVAARARARARHSALPTPAVACVRRSSLATSQFPAYVAVPC